MLTQVGYKQVYNVTKGIMGWIQEGKAVVRQ
jgi:rhodanese-related sulfurtransferase